MWCTVCVLHLFHWSRSLVDRVGKLMNWQRRIQDYMEDSSASPLRLGDSLPPLHSHCRSWVQSICTSAVSMKRQVKNCTWKKLNETWLHATNYLLFIVEFANIIYRVWIPSEQNYEEVYFIPIRHIICSRVVKKKNFLNEKNKIKNKKPLAIQRFVASFWNVLYINYLTVAITVSRFLVYLCPFFLTYLLRVPYTAFVKSGIENQKMLSICQNILLWGLLQSINQLIVPHGLVCGVITG